MKTSLKSLARPACLIAALLFTFVTSRATTTIDATNSFAYGANIGWVNFRGDVTNGAAVGEYVLSGFIYGANVGWISLGSGTPVNGIGYQNNSATDFGVNVQPSASTLKASLRGFAYGANIGWINFENTGNPQVDLMTGALSGYAYGANVGWINLGQLGVNLMTDSIKAGTDSDGDGIADAFERFYVDNLTTMNATSDLDGDGKSDLDEYLGATDPFDVNSTLRITSFGANADGSAAEIIWTSVPSRKYRVEAGTVLGSWSIALDNIVPDSGATTVRMLLDAPARQRFFRVQAFSPLLAP